MGFKCGIIGLPNVGKSTLFNAMTSTISADAQNYPFCTIEPNLGAVAVKDLRLEKISSISKSEKTIPTNLEFVDIAGLVRGASSGEGLGNKFLSHIREVEAIIHILRCFDNPKITHVEENIDPIRDMDIVETELMLTDIESLGKQSEKIKTKVKAGDKSATKKSDLIQKILEHIKINDSLRDFLVPDEEESDFKSLNLLTKKPVLYVCNVEEKSAVTGNEFTKKVFGHCSSQGNKSIILSCQLESEISQTPNLKEKKQFLSNLGLKDTGLSKLVTDGYLLLNLITYFTTGPKESRAWTILKGSTAQTAAGKIHSDFEKGFIRAETVSFEDFIDCRGEQQAKIKGKIRQEGKEYIVQDGDIMNFKFNV